MTHGGEQTDASLWASSRCRSSSSRCITYKISPNGTAKNLAPAAPAALAGQMGRVATARVAQHRLLQRVHLPIAASVSAGARGPRFAAGKAVKAPRSTQHAAHASQEARSKAAQGTSNGQAERSKKQERSKCVKSIGNMCCCLLRTRDADRQEIRCPPRC